MSIMSSDKIDDNNEESVVRKKKKSKKQEVNPDLNQCSTQILDETQHLELDNETKKRQKKQKPSKSISAEHVELNETVENQIQSSNSCQEDYKHVQQKLKGGGLLEIKRYLGDKTADTISNKIESDLLEYTLQRVKKKKGKLKDQTGNVQLDQANQEIHSNNTCKSQTNWSEAILEIPTFKSKELHVNKLLPRWLAQPIKVSSDLKNLTVEISTIKQLDKRLKKKLAEMKFTHLFPIQVQLIEWVLNTNKHAHLCWPQDALIAAPTGSGKTFAFVLPIVQILSRQAGPKQIRALVILPTDVLATQVGQIFNLFCKKMDLSVYVMMADGNFEQQKKDIFMKNTAFGYVSKCDILICTPGRLTDHMVFGEGFNLDYLEFLIIDEADRILQGNFENFLSNLEDQFNKNSCRLPKFTNLYTMEKRRPPQKFLCSATLASDPEDLHRRCNLFQPKLFTTMVDQSSSNSNHDHNFQRIDQESTEVSSEMNKPVTDQYMGKVQLPDELTQNYIVCDENIKPLTLYYIILKYKLQRVLVFLNSREEVLSLSLLLKYMFENDRIKVECIQMSQSIEQRRNVMADFKKGKLNVLICTDAMARGIDIPNVNCVISYSACPNLQTYVHRVGRTARAGQSGLAISVLQYHQVRYFLDMISSTYKRSDVPNYIDRTEFNENEISEKQADNYQRCLFRMRESLKDSVKQQKGSMPSTISSSSSSGRSGVNRNSERKRKFMDSNKNARTVDSAIKGGTFKNNEESNPKKKLKWGRFTEDKKNLMTEIDKIR